MKGVEARFQHSELGLNTLARQTVYHAINRGMLLLGNLPLNIFNFRSDFSR